MGSLKGNMRRGTAFFERDVINFCLFPLILILFSGFSFFLGGYNCIKNTLRTYKNVNSASLQVKPVIFPECGLDYHDYTPCTDPKRWKQFSSYRLSFYERHCPPAFERKECLVPPPNGYMVPVKWPESRNQCWYRNVPYDWIENEKSNQHWLKKVGDKFFFPGGGTMFPDGVGSYVDKMEDLIPAMVDGTVRTAIDTGCGVASWGGSLLDRGILTVSLAPRDYHEAQVQFALERGIPAMLGVLSTQRLPFPANSFDMAHCSRCLIPWTEFGGIYLAEVHRILRPGGFWVLSGPPVNYQNRWFGWGTTVNEQESNLRRLENLLDGMCFKFYAGKDDIAVWQKASNNNCYDRLKKSDNFPPICDFDSSPDETWYVPLRACISIPNQNDMKKGGLSLANTPKWPQRLNTRPNRGKARNFKQSNSKWNRRIVHYKSLLPAFENFEIRNVMDMNTVYGSFAASLIGEPLWVMNVVSTYAAPTLGIIFDRGLIGTYHDWREAFSTYPRTYDLLHADGLFTEENHRFEMKHVMLEMDRILRPYGHAIIRESDYYMDAIATIGKGMRWDCKKHETEDNSKGIKVMICKKKLWYSSQTNFTRLVVL